MSLHTTADTRFDSFNLFHTSYEKFDDHEIEVIVIVPKTVTPGNNPMLVKWHGGGLVSIASVIYHVRLTLDIRLQEQQHI